MGAGRSFVAGDVVVARETSKRGIAGKVAFWHRGRVRVVEIPTIALMVLEPAKEAADPDLMVLKDGQTLDHLATA